MSKLYYKSGDRVGECLFISESDRHYMPSGRNTRTAIFMCECGNHFKSIIDNVRRLKTTGCHSCKNSKLSKSKIKYEPWVIHSEEYGIWNGMRNRCNNKNNQAYPGYGGRGLRVCKKWDNSFMSFFKDMGKRPTSNHSLERIKNNLGYSKNNCTWATPHDQANNRRSNIQILYNGEVRNLMQWCNYFNLTYSTISQRIKSGWDIKKAFETPIKKFKCQK